MALTKDSRRYPTDSRSSRLEYSLEVWPTDACEHIDGGVDVEVDQDVLFGVAHMVLREGVFEKSRRSERLHHEGLGLVTNSKTEVFRTDIFAHKVSCMEAFNYFDLVTQVYHLEGQDDGSRYVELFVAMQKIVLQCWPQHLCHQNKAFLSFQALWAKPEYLREKNSVR